MSGRMVLSMTPPRTAEAKVLAEDWRFEYNHHRPHSRLGYKTPTAFAAACLASAPAWVGPAPPPNRTQNVDNSPSACGT